MTNLLPPKSLSRLALMVLNGAFVFGIGCGGGSVSDGTGPITPVDTTKPPVGTVPRGTITVRVSIDPLDQSVASVAGVNVAGLTVRLTRQLSSDAPLSVTTGSDGVVRFENLLEGVYNASIDRPLTSSEQAQLPPTDRDATVFAGGALITFTPPQSEVMMPLVASRRGSLIISEVFVYRYPAGGPTYGYGTYTEVYNAADTTIYLDGFLIGTTWGGMHQGNITNFPCTTFNIESRLDNASIWLSNVQGFPGSGREYPIAPGQAKVIAMDAMNHIAASPTTNQVDLSNADFEQHGDDADIDNPFVPDLVRVLGGIGVFGRGYPAQLEQAYVLLAPASSANFIADEIVGQQGGKIPAYRVPPAFVFDVMTIRTRPEIIAATGWYQGGGRYCSPFLSPVFERDPAQIGDYYLRKAMRRKSLGFTASGIELLQRTHTSSRDLEYAEPLRRSLNK